MLGACVSPDQVASLDRRLSTLESRAEAAESRVSAAEARANQLQAAANQCNATCEAVEARAGQIYQQSLRRQFACLYCGLGAVRRCAIAARTSPQWTAAAVQGISLGSL
jgi:hypothetical protein